MEKLFSHEETFFIRKNISRMGKAVQSMAGSVLLHTPGVNAPGPHRQMHRDRASFFQLGTLARQNIDQHAARQHAGLGRQQHAILAGRIFRNHQLAAGRIQQRGGHAVAAASQHRQQPGPAAHQRGGQTGVFGTAALVRVGQQ